MSNMPLIAKASNIIKAIPAVLYALLIWHLSSQPKAPVALIYAGLPIDKLFHFVEFFIFGLLILFALAGIKGSRRYSSAFLLAVSYAIIDEMHQLYVPARTFSIYDIFADALGIIIAILFVKYLAPKGLYISNITPK